MSEPITKIVLCPNCGNSIPRPPPGAIGKCRGCDSDLVAPDADGLWCRAIGPVELDAILAKAAKQAEVDRRMQAIGAGAIGGGRRIH